jgi:hypothetical protein
MPKKKETNPQSVIFFKHVCMVLYVADDEIQRQREVSGGDCYGLMGSASPCAMFILYPGVGALEALFGSPAVPLFLGAIYAMVSFLCFVALPKEQVTH